MTNLEIESGNLVGCSVRGPSHESDDIPCQDAWHGRRLGDDQYVLAVADGLGEANLSHKGSAQATEEVISILEDRSDKLSPLDEEPAQEILKNAFIRTQSVLAEEAKKSNEQPSEFLTTLLTVIVGPSGVAGAVVGDGGIVYDRKDSYEPLVPREMTVIDLPSSDVTIPIQHDGWEQSYRFGYRKECDGIAVFTDGFDEFAWDGLDSTNTEFFSSVFELVRNIEYTEEAEKRMAEIFNNEPYSKYSSDDKTLAVADIKPGSTMGGDSGTVNSSKSLSSETASSSNSESSSNKEPDKIETRDGKILSLSTQFGSSAQGSMFLLADTSGIVKLFKPALRGDENLKNKLLKMISASHPSTNQFVWPTDIIMSSKQNQFVGYKSELPHPKLQEWHDVLDYAARNKYNKKNIKIGFDAEDRRKTTIATELARTVDTLHHDGHSIGDFHHNNVLTDQKDNVVLTGCETFHICGNNSVHQDDRISSRYAPADERDLSEERKNTDLFGLAVHIFQLLMGGFHPFHMKKTKNRDDKKPMIDPESEDIRLDKGDPYPYPYPAGVDESPSNTLEYSLDDANSAGESDIKPPSRAPEYSPLPSEIKALFDQCFTEARTQPNARPSAGEWVEALRNSPV